MGPIYRILTGGLLASLLLLNPTPAQAAEPVPSAYLVDISAPHWCFDCVGKVVNDYRLMDGYTDHTFRGDWKVTRFALAAVTNKLLNQIRLTHAIDIQPVVKREAIVPALPEHWAYPYVRTLLQEYDLTQVMFDKAQAKDGDQPATRKHVAYVLSELLMRAEKASGKSLGEGIRMAEKSQDMDARSQYSPYIAAALNRYQFMNLYHDHTFRPENTISRYEMAAVLCRVTHLLETHLSNKSAAEPTAAAQ
ncbi:MAG: S-layer homology domain-containing protein [Candidatus Sericytochromatia bacterium]